MSEQFLTPSPSIESYFFTQFSGGKGSITERKPFVAVIYAGSDDVTVTVYRLPKLKKIVSNRMELETHNPHPGWYEQDAEEIISAVYNCCTCCCYDLLQCGYISSEIKAISITNHRETLIVWDALTGRPLYRAIAADDRRATELAERIISSLPGENENHYKPITGMPLQANYAALKILWLRENVDEVRSAIEDGSCKFGTLDSWIIWNLTRGALHVTDVTNASHTMLMNIKTLNWDERLLKAFSLNGDTLPCICPCSKAFGRVTDPASMLRNAQIAGIIADQQSLLVGQLCLHAGKMSVHFGGDCCLLCHTGDRCVMYRDAITTVAYKLGDSSRCMYALEGNVLKCGKLFEWLQSNFRLLSDEKSAENVANSVKTTNHVYLVPAFAGLRAPFWRKDARGVLVGLTDKTSRGHVVRAAFESICFQAYDIIECMRNSGEFDQDVIYAAGPRSSMGLLMQMLADTSGVIVVRFNKVDSMAYGAAMCAGKSIDAIDMPHIMQGIWRKSSDFTTFTPFGSAEERIERYAKWRHAVALSVGWAEKSEALHSGHYRMLRHGITMSVLLVTVVLLIKAIFKKSNN